MARRGIGAQPARGGARVRTDPETRNVPPARRGATRCRSRRVVATLWQDYIVHEPPSPVRRTLARWTPHQPAAVARIASQRPSLTHGSSVGERTIRVSARPGNAIGATRLWGVMKRTAGAMDNAEPVPASVHELAQPTGVSSARDELGSVVQDHDVLAVEPWLQFTHAIEVHDG